MKPGTYPLEISKDKKLDIEFTWKDKDGDLVDLSGCMAVMELFASSEDESPLAHLSDFADSAIVLDGEKGTIHLSIEYTPLLEHIGAYRFNIHTADDEIVNLLKGSVKIS